MLPIKKIVCPTDFSEAGFPGVAAGAELARHLDATLILIHVVAPVPPPMSAGPDQVPFMVASFDVNSYEDELVKHYREKLEELVREKLGDVKTCCPTVTIGLAADEIVRLAHDENADLIVIATHGRTGWRHMVFGSVAERVTRTAQRPVLVVPSVRKQG